MRPKVPSQYSLGKLVIIFLTGNVKEDANQLLISLGFDALKDKPLNIKFVHLLLDPNDPQDISESNWKSTVFQ